VLFIGTQFSNLYTAVDTPVMGCVSVGVCLHLVEVLRCHVTESWISR
jgi:hypothetical protein